MKHSSATTHNRGKKIGLTIATLDTQRTTVYRYLRKFGSSSSAYHTLQPGLEYWIEPGAGYIAFKTSGRNFLGRKIVTVIGDPVCDYTNLNLLLQNFLNCHPDAAFYLIGLETASELSRLGHYVNEFGIETILELPYDLKGNRRSEIRLLSNRARSANVEVREFDRRARLEAGIQDSDIKTLINSWLSSRTQNRREFTLLSRRFEYSDELDCRKFYATCGDKLVGVGVFDPIYRKGRIDAYSETMARVSRTAPKGTRDILLLKAMEQLAREDVKYVSLGLSPLERVQEVVPLAEKLRRSRFTTKWLDFTYRRLNGIVFNFQGLSFKKSRYVGNLEMGGASLKKVYCGFSTRFPVAELFNAGRLTTNVGISTAGILALNLAAIAADAFKEVISA